MMLVRNINDKEVLDTTYLAHGGAIAQMILDGRTLKEIGFLAIARLSPERKSRHILTRWRRYTLS